MFDTHVQLFDQLLLFQDEILSTYLLKGGKCHHISVNQRRNQVAEKVEHHERFILVHDRDAVIFDAQIAFFDEVFNFAHSFFLRDGVVVEVLVAEEFLVEHNYVVEGPHCNGLAIVVFIGEHFVFEEYGKAAFNQQ